ncbi:MAG: AMP-binding protein [Betaproteobacteria bacterium]|nr:AMP-binding protein [Betaproteobacteria bacterium]
MIAIGDTAPAWGHDYEALLARSPASEPEVDIAESDPYYFNLTSGTTGLPKSYVLTQFNNSSIGAFMDGFDLSRRDVVMTVFPMFGRVGFAWTLGAAMFGLKNVLMNFAPAERDLSSLRAVVYAGSMLPPTVRDQTMARLCPSLYDTTACRKPARWC